MATELEYALMSDASYISTRDEIYRVPAPAGWEQIGYKVMDATTDDPGFECASYMHGDDIVIADTGTGAGISDWDANFGLGERENIGLVYAARILLDQSVIQVGEKLVNLTPGMAVTAEVKTGKRRIIEYLLAPLLRHKAESLQER